MKSLLQKLFHNYAAEMGQLNSSLMSSKQEVRSLEREFDRRFGTLETAMAARKADRDEASTGGEKYTRADTLTFPNDRLEKLEALSKIYAYRTCNELKALGITITGRYFLDPDGNGIDSEPPIQVHCDMTTGATRIDHDLQGPQSVRNCQEPGCSVHRASYGNISMKQINFLITLSEHCEQHIKYECKGAPLNKVDQNETVPLAWWSDRHGDIHFYWFSDGIASNSETVGCLCQQGSCNGSGCKCDGANINLWESDEGHLTNKDQLPVMKLNFAGTHGSRNRAAKFELGPLYCTGKSTAKSRKYFSSSPTSCHDLLLRRLTQTGYYLVKDRQEKFPKLVFCDMSKQPDQVGFQRIFGSPGNLKPFSAFDVSLRSPFTDDYRYVNFSKANVNIGESFNIQDGIFTVPETGVYIFSIHALPMKNRPCKLQIHHNGIAVAEVSNGNNGKSMIGQTIVRQLATGDEIRVYNNGGDTDEDNDSRTSFFHFVGVLVHSSDRG